MKSVGEVMAIGRTFEEAYQKAIRMLDLEFEGAVNERMLTNGNTADTKKILSHPTPYRMFALSKAFYESIPLEEIYKLSGIDPWFLHRIQSIVDEEKNLAKKKDLTKENVLRLKQLGFSDKRIGMLVDKTGLEIRALRKRLGITPSVFQIDTLAGEFPAKTNYLYMTYNGDHFDVTPTKKDGVMVLGSGPYRIGSSVEFDWTTVNTALSLKKHKKKSIMINCNPETVSTDYDISDRLYFEELTFERIADIYDFENPHGIIISVGGQTPNNRAHSLKMYGCTILGTDPVDIDRAEDRSKFSKLLDKLNVIQPEWETLRTLDELKKFCERVGFPVLLRPSYVLSGAYMRICHTLEELTRYTEEATLVSHEYPITVSKFIEDAQEIEFDAVAQEGIVLASVISEHVENAGVHSGDATIVLPPQRIFTERKKVIEDISSKLAKALRISGPFNIQFLAKDTSVSVIEINLRASRTLPFISKVTGTDFVGLAVNAFFHVKQKPVQTHIPAVAVKVAQFSFSRLTGADPVLRVEMASTGEVACFGDDVEEAFLKGFLSVGGRVPKKGIFVSIGTEKNKLDFIDSASYLLALNLPIYATEKTAEFLQKSGVKTHRLYKVHEEKSPNVLEVFQKGKIDLAINISETYTQDEITDGYIIRRTAVDHNITLLTNLQKAELFLKAISEKKLSDLKIKSWDEYMKRD